jgi:hypothetical protein
VLKRGLQALSGYNTNLNERNSPSQLISRKQYLLRYGRCSCDPYSRCSVWFPCISTQLAALRRAEMRTLSKIPGCTRISRQAFSTRCCNTSNSLSSAEYTEVFTRPHSQNSRGSRSEDRAGLGLRVLSTVHRKSGSGAV